MEKQICSFCEIEFSQDAIFCSNCKDYKGLMSVSDFEIIYGDKRPVWR